MMDKQGYMHSRACTRPRARAHARKHTQISNICCFSTATIIRERASVLRHTYIIRPVLLQNQVFSVFRMKELL